jgi:hypothetical protein
MPETNNTHKDRLFCMIFGREENKDCTLSLYNAINGSSYSDPSKIEIYTIDDVLYMSMHNDVAFILRDVLSLYEHQSTINPNMPVRMLSYLGMLYEKYIEKNRFNKYGSKLIPLPTPKLVVFFNGKQDIDDTVLQLRSSFPADSSVEPDISLSVKMLNVNYGHNKELMAACRPLRDYALFVDVVRQAYSEGKDMEAAFNLGITALEDGSRLKQYLLGHKAEVTHMLLTEYNEEETMNMFKAEAREEGIEIGIELGIEKGIEKGTGMKDAEYKKALSLFRQGASTLEEFTSQGITEDVARTVLGIE